jgi:uncharacterized protein (DUF2147 family)
MWRSTAALGLAVALSGQAFAATPAEGLWRTQTNNGEVRISECGAALCGRLVTSDRIKLDPEQKDGRNKDESQRGRTLRGILMLDGFSGGPTEWKGGKVYNPDDGGTYKGTIKMTAPNQLKLTGCITWPLCKSQTWTRIE